MGIILKSQRELDKIADEIRRAGKGKQYDSIMGLSGGVDSSAVVATAAGVVEGRLPTFTIGFSPAVVMVMTSPPTVTD